MAKFTHRVGLHFRSLSLTNISFQTLLKSAELVYAQYGIQVVFRSGQSLGLSEAEAKRFEQVDGTCKWKITSGEYRDVQKLGGPVSPTEILVYYVKRFSKAGSLGCGGHIPGHPACIVAASGSRWTTAHEVGHVLLGSSFIPVHSSDTKNLMYKSTPGISAKLPILTNKQVTQIKKSPCCVRIS